MIELKSSVYKLVVTVVGITVILHSLSMSKDLCECSSKTLIQNALYAYTLLGVSLIFISMVPRNILSMSLIFVSLVLIIALNAYINDKSKNSNCGHAIRTLSLVGSLLASSVVFVILAMMGYKFSKTQNAVDLKQSLKKDLSDIKEKL